MSWLSAENIDELESSDNAHEVVSLRENAIGPAYGWHGLAHISHLEITKSDVLKEENGYGL